jgi:hypothetical protein
MSWVLMRKYTAFTGKGKYFGTVFRSDFRRDNPLFPENSGCRCRYPENSITFAACTDSRYFPEKEDYPCGNPIEIPCQNISPYP